MNKVHFCSLLCPDYDLDLMDQWCLHYLKYRFDTYKIFIHSPFDNKDKCNLAKTIARDFGFETEIVAHEIFGNGQLRSSVISERMKEFSPNDKMVTTDSDEFQMVPENYRELALQYDIIRGFHVDRYDTTLHDANPFIPLEEQYPLSGNVEEEVLKTVDVKSRQRWPTVQKSKILSCTIKYPVMLSGSHDIFPVKSGPEPTVYPTKFPVLHYTWRSSIVKRMAGKDYFQAAHIWYFKKFFSNGQDPLDSEMQGIIDMEEHTQNMKGWVPA